jgi:hypothetical protein
VRLILQSSLLRKQLLDIFIKLFLIVKGCLHQNKLLVSLLVLKISNISLRDLLQLVKAAHKFLQLHILPVKFVTHSI